MPESDNKTEEPTQKRLSEAQAAERGLRADIHERAVRESGLAVA